MDCPPGKTPWRTSRSPSTMRLATAINRPKQMSAVASVTIAGAVVTATPRRVASSTSMSEGVTAIDAIPLRLRFAAMIAPSILSCMSESRKSQSSTAASKASLGRMRLESGLTVDVGERSQSIKRARCDGLGDKNARPRGLIHQTAPLTWGAAASRTSRATAVAPGITESVRQRSLAYGVPRARCSQLRLAVPCRPAATPARSSQSITQRAAIAEIIISTAKHQKL